MADPLSVPCGDCAVPEGTPCVFSAPVFTGDDDTAPVHADRQRTADLGDLEHGTCGLCGALMVRGVVEGAPEDAWHPDPVDAAVCPPIPDPATDAVGWAAAINGGRQPGHPGAEHFIPDGTPEQPARCDGACPVTEEHDAHPVYVCRECTDGKHRNCDGRAWDTAADAPTSCDCPDADHAPTTAPGPS